MGAFSSWGLLLSVGLENLEGKPMYQTKQKCGFLGYMVTIENTEGLFCGLSGASWLTTQVSPDVQVLTGSPGALLQLYDSQSI